MCAITQCVRVDTGICILFPSSDSSVYHLQNAKSMDWVLSVTQNLTLTLDDLAHQTNWPPNNQNCPPPQKKIAKIENFQYFRWRLFHISQGGLDPLKVNWFDEQSQPVGLSNFRTPYQRPRLVLSIIMTQPRTHACTLHTIPKFAIWTITYTLLQKKCTLISPSSPGDPESLNPTPGHAKFVKWSYSHVHFFWRRL